MSKRHNALFEDVLKGFDAAPAAQEDRGGTRFLKRSNALAETGEREEKVLRWVDPAQCVMWDRHNREYALLTEQNCADLIGSIKAQGRQEFPAIVRRRAGQGAEYEVICGARRHFAISWLRQNNYPQFRYLVDVRDLTDEEAFRLADIENRDREDISDFERARDYAQALDAYYGGRQKAMAERLEVSEAWLSRYLQLAKMPDEIIRAYPTLREMKELHARVLKPLLADPKTRDRVFEAAGVLAEEQAAARAGQGAAVAAALVLSRLKAAGTSPVKGRAQRPTSQEAVVVTRRKGRVTFDFAEALPDDQVRASMERFLANRKLPIGNNR